MKRIFLITFLLLLASFGLIASTTPGNTGAIELLLDLGSTTIGKIGFDDEVPTITVDTLPSDPYLSTSLGEISIGVDNTTGRSVRKTFYIWWYLYTKNEFTIKCNATNWQGTSNGNEDFIQFDAEFKNSEGTSIGSLSLDDAANARDDVEIYAHDNSTGLNVGWASITIPAFHFLDKTKDSYSTTISFTFTSV